MSRWTALQRSHPCRHLLVGFHAAVTLYFAVVANISIASLNLSLLVNSVGFYQVRRAQQPRQPWQRLAATLAIHMHAERCWLQGQAAARSGGHSP